MGLILSFSYMSFCCLFQKNIAIQMKLNQNRTDYKSAWYGPTKFFDLSPKEFSGKYLKIRI